MEVKQSFEIVENLWNERQIAKGLKGRKLKTVADESGLSYAIIQRMSRGRTDGYTFRSIKTISKYLDSIGQKQE